MKSATQSAMVFGILITALGFSSSIASADFYLHPWENHAQSDGIGLVSLSGGYYSTGTDFDPNGNLFVPAGLVSYARIQFDLSFAYSFSPHLTAFARATWADVNVNNPNRGGTGYGFADQTVGLDYRLLQNQTGLLQEVDLQAQGDFPAYSDTVSDANLTPHMGDQTVDVTAGAFAKFRLWQRATRDNFLTAGLGYTFRTGSFSSAVPWSVFAQTEPKSLSSAKGFFSSVGAAGIISLVNDPRAYIAGNITSSAVSVSTGGSYIADAIDPNLTVIAVKVGYQTSDRLRFSINATDALAGRQAPNGFYFFAMLEKRIGGESHANGAEDKEVVREFGRANPGFISYNIDAHVNRVSDRLSLVKIDKGSDDGIQVGQLFDIFSTQSNGNAVEPVARAQVNSVHSNESALTIQQYYKETWIEEGFLARRISQ